MWRPVATGPTALPTHRVMIPATIAITVGGINPVIFTFRARTSGPSAQENPRRLADVHGRVETISDHVFFVPPSSRVYMGDIRQLLSNETILIYATLINHFNSKMKSLKDGLWKVSADTVEMLDGLHEAAS